MSMLIAVILGLAGVALIIAGATNSAPNLLAVLTGNGPGSADKVGAGATAATLTRPAHGGTF